MALDERCELDADDPALPQVDARIRREFETACGSTVAILKLRAACERGRDHWVDCDGTAWALEPEDKVYAAMRAESEASERRQSLIREAHSRDLLRRWRSSDKATAAIRARRVASAQVARDDDGLQAELDWQCEQQRLDRVLLSDVDAYDGPLPDSIFCDSLSAGGRSFALDRTTRTWRHRD